MSIQPGDLVMVVHSCCGDSLGLVFKVDWIGARPSYCPECQTDIPDPVAHNADGVDGHLCYWPVAWLKKLDAPSTPEHVERREELTA